MHLIFIGPPGSGKGTQAKLLAERLGLVHISTGDLLREAIRAGSTEGKQAEPYVAAGDFVPDEIVNAMVAARFRGPDRPESSLMDGYPRDVAQARVFDKLLEEIGLELDAVIYLDVGDDELVERLTSRWNCPNPACKETYNTVSKAPRQAGVCDLCQTKLVQRDDDKVETVRRRLQVFHDLTSPLRGYYRKQGVEVEVPGVGDIETIYKRIVDALRHPET